VLEYSLPLPAWTPVRVLGYKGESGAVPRNVSYSGGAPDFCSPYKKSNETGENPSYRIRYRIILNKRESR